MLNLRHWSGVKPTWPVPAIDTPFAKAAAVVDRRDGHARLLAHYAWLVNAVLLCACFGLGLGWYSQTQKSTVEAFYVPINELGQPAEIIPAKREFTLSDAVMAAFLKRFVEETFAKSKDPVVNGRVVGCVVLVVGWYSRRRNRRSRRFTCRSTSSADRPKSSRRKREFTLSDAVMAAFLKRFVEETFAKSKDPVVNGQRQQFMRSSVIGTARQTMMDWSKTADLDKNVGTDKRTSRFITAKQTANPMTWNVIWEETFWEEGTRIRSRRMNGDFTFEQIPPRTTAELAANPLGLYVTDLHWEVENQ